MKRPFDESFEIKDGLVWGTLKYGLCSYFALAYATKYPGNPSFLAIKEYDEEMEKEYLVHYLVIQQDGSFRDAEGVYNDWDDSVREMTDIEFMELRTAVVDKEAVRACIEEDMGFDTALFQTICDVVQEQY